MSENRNPCLLRINDHKVQLVLFAILKTFSSPITLIFKHCETMAQGAKDRHRNQSYHQALSSTNEIIDACEDKFEMPKPINADVFEKQEDSEKMGTILSTFNLLCLKVSQIDNAIVHEDTGLHSRLATCQTQSDNNSDLKYENGILKGLVQKQSKQIDSLTNRLTQVTAKSMEKNLIVTGICEEGKKENCADLALKFFKEQVKIDALDSEILVAHRKGFPNDDGTDCLMVVRCAIPLKERAPKNAKT